MASGGGNHPPVRHFTPAGLLRALPEKEREATGSASLSLVAWAALRLVMKVNANVEPVVVPVGLMIAAPLAGFVHFGDVVRNLAALLAVLGNVAVDAGAIRFQPSLAFVFVVRAHGVSKSKRKPTRQRASQCDSRPDFAVFHGRLRGIPLVKVDLPRPQGVLHVTAIIFTRATSANHRGKAALCQHRCLICQGMRFSEVTASAGDLFRWLAAIWSVSPVTARRDRGHGASKRRRVKGNCKVARLRKGGQLHRACEAERRVRKFNAHR
jgi:hypothetical protein